MLENKIKTKQVCGLKSALKQIQKTKSYLVADSEAHCFIWKSNFTRQHFIEAKNKYRFKL